jgi:hypothetical protein
MADVAMADIETIQFAFMLGDVSPLPHVKSARKGILNEDDVSPILFCSTIEGGVS